MARGSCHHGSAEPLTRLSRNCGIATLPPRGRGDVNSHAVQDTSFLKGWCGRGDSNPHALASVSPSSWCVCQFRHFRKKAAFSCQQSAISKDKTLALTNRRTGDN